MSTLINQEQVKKEMSSRLFKNNVYKALFIVATIFALAVLVILFYRIFSQGMKYFDVDFFTSFASRRPSEAGILGALVGSLWLLVIIAPLSIFLGVGTALYLEEYAKKNRFTRFIELNISNLAGVPSIVFGLLGLTIFVRGMNLGGSILAGGLTMSLLILPIIVVASQEAIRTVPKALREASYGMGATKWQTIRRVVLPAAIPGILTGSILALSRAIGETAPLIVIGALSFVNYLPSGFMDTFTVLPMQIFNWTSRPQEEFQFVAASGIIVLLIVLIVMNSIAVLIRNKFQKNY
ncbi:phosphate ABC transporter permease PstA [Priestia taiwanensis]|uniref:Phosphate transport system permease protein PstA n=1 Tax=Priestia taiwanensis TaxID=1347902 RepID=A0A917AVP0_9BACI|nr:phosphate ABC transporter permease PstA [Priestia taiwanensis]MBM7363792.1 phosphate transport system permease protein [Priestia taiwanensis]GGE74058.1 phosphate transport system permease protein PstA [Priestia taiwanensis]